MGRLAGELAAAKRGRDYKPHAVDVALGKMDDEDRQAVLDALNDVTFTAPVVAELMVAHGHLVGVGDPAGRVRDWRKRHGLGRA